MKEYSKHYHDLWVKEVKETYSKIKSNMNSYVLNFLGNDLTVFPNVFSPKYFNNTKWYAEKLPDIVGVDSLLEIGTGTGAIALQCYLKGATVIATDISKDAYDCANFNFRFLNCNIQTYLGDVFEPIPANSKFDYIFWNHPYNNSADIIDDDLIIAGFDYNYNSLRKYIKGASKFLNNPNKGLLLGTGGHADLKTIFEICSKYGYSLKLLEYVNMPLNEATTAPNDFRIYELLKEDNINKDDLWKLHTNVADSVKVADNKALIVFGVIGLVLTLYGIAINYFAPDLKNSQIFLTILLSSGLYSLISILTAIYSIFSKLHKIYKIKSNLFFKDISDNKDLEIFLHTFESHYNLEEDLKTQIFAISRIATNKHILLRWSVAFLIFAIIGLSISLLFILLK